MIRNILQSFTNCISGNYSSKFSETILEIFWYFSRNLFRKFSRKFRKYSFLNILYPFKIEIENLWVTENLAYRPVMSLLELLFTNESQLVFLSPWLVLPLTKRNIRIKETLDHNRLVLIICTIKIFIKTLQMFLGFPVRNKGLRYFEIKDFGAFTKK